MSTRVSIIRLSALLLLLSSDCASLRAQEKAYLDATHTQIRHRLRDPATGGSGFRSSWTEGQKAPPQPLALSLKILGRADFARDDVFEYEVQIRNTSQQPVEIPWDLNSADIEPADPRASYQYQTTAIYVHAKIGENRAISMEGPILLFGSPSIASTMIRLEPGEWVRIRAKGKVRSSNPNDAWPPSTLTSKDVDGTLEASLILDSSSFSPGAGGNSHEESQITKGPISSNEYNVHFRL
jgi:hypothetical protein